MRASGRTQEKPLSLSLLGLFSGHSSLTSQPVPRARAGEQVPQLACSGVTAWPLPSACPTPVPWGPLFPAPCPTALSLLCDPQASPQLLSRLPGAHRASPALTGGLWAGLPAGDSVEAQLAGPLPGPWPRMVPSRSESLSWLPATCRSPWGSGPEFSPSSQGHLGGPPGPPACRSGGQGLDPAGVLPPGWHSTGGS